MAFLNAFCFAIKKCNLTVEPAPRGRDCHCGSFSSFIFDNTGQHCVMLPLIQFSERAKVRKPEKLQNSKSWQQHIILNLLFLHVDLNRAAVVQYFCTVPFFRTECSEIFQN